MHPEATRNHYYQPLIASYYYLAIITSFKSLFLIFGNFEPVLHWSRWVLSVVSVVEEVQSRSFSCGSTTTTTNRYQVGGWISGPLSRSYIHVAEWKQWKQWCRTSIPGLFALEGSATSDSRYKVGGWVEFQDVWAGLAHLSRWVKKRSCFLYLLWALESIYGTGIGSLWIKS